LSQVRSHIAGLAALVLTAGFAAAPAWAAASGTFTTTGSLSTVRTNDTATLLRSGEVLIAGGAFGGTPTLTSAELYNLATGKFTATGSMDIARMHGNAVLLQDGDVLVTSGISAGGPFAELYHPATGAWSDAIGGVATCTPVQDCRFYSSETLLANGSVLVAGGMTGLASNPSTTRSAMLYNPATNAWTATGAMNTDRGQQTATLLNNGQVLMAGGISFHAHRATELASAELYTP
jgi:hypothetical protein